MKWKKQSLFFFVNILWVSVSPHYLIGRKERERNYCEIKKLMTIIKVTVAEAPARSVRLLLCDKASEWSELRRKEVFITNLTSSPKECLYLQGFDPAQCLFMDASLSFPPIHKYLCALTPVLWCCIECKFNIAYLLLWHCSRTCKAVTLQGISINFKLNTDGELKMEQNHQLSITA